MCNQMKHLEQTWIYLGFNIVGHIWENTSRTAQNINTSLDMFILFNTEFLHNLYQEGLSWALLTIRRAQFWQCYLLRARQTLIGSCTVLDTMKNQFLCLSWACPHLGWAQMFLSPCPPWLCCQCAGAGQ